MYIRIILHDSYESVCTVYWESSAEEKVRKFCESGTIRECFLALFNLSRNFYI